MKKMRFNLFPKTRIPATIAGIALLLLPPPASAQEFQKTEEQIEFSLSWGDPTPDEPGHGKAPLRLPQAWLSDYLLDFHGSHAEYVLNVVDNTTNTVVYTTPVPSSVTQVMLPATLSGDYRIELIMGSWLFYGYITL